MAAEEMGISSRTFDMLIYHGYRFRLWMRHNSTKVFITSVMFMAFSYNVFLNLEEHQRQGSIVILDVPNRELAQFPPLYLCVVPPFHPLRLVPFGLNISTDSVEELTNRIYHLTGIRRDIEGGKLLEGAGWQMQDFIEELRIGDTILKPLTKEGEILSKLWGRSFIFAGPCLKFYAPSDTISHSSNIAWKIRDRPSTMRPCAWVIENAIEDFSNPETCNSIKHYCNTSCVWENYISKSDYFLYLYLPSVYRSYDIDKSAVEERVFTGLTLEFFPFEMYNDFSEGKEYASNRCLNQKIMEKVGGKLNCLPMNNWEYLKKSLDSLCLTGDQIFYPYIYTLSTQSQSENIGMEFSCKPVRNELRWKINRKWQHEKGSSQIRIKLVSSVKAVFHKIHLYPLRKLLEDIGGSLGMFLGISLNELWLGMLEYWLSHKSKWFSSQRYYSLFKLSGLVFVASLFCIHSLENLANYYSDVDVTSVTMAHSLCEEQFQTNVTLPLSDALSLHIASRPLQCQLLTLSTEQKCFFDCLQKSHPLFPLSFMFLDDLPVCQYHHFTWPQIKFIIPGSINSFTEGKSYLINCDSRCKSYNSSVYLRNGTPIIMRGYVVDFVSVACAFGGIVGLYFGYSMQDLPYHFRRVKVFALLPNWLRRGSVFVWRVVTIIICLLLCVNVFKKYLYSHPVYSEPSTSHLIPSEIPTVNVCFWPPFNVEKLFALTGTGRLQEKLNELNSKEKQDTISDLIQSLAKMNISKTFSARSLWENIAWSGREYIFVANDGLSSSNRSIFNVCYTINGTFLYRKKVASVSYFMYWSLNASSYEGEISTYAFIHQLTDDLPIGNDLVGETRGDAMKLKRVSKWFPLKGESVKPEETFLHCLDNLLVDQMQCVLPWVEWREDLEPCNISQFMTFLSFLWAVRPGRFSVYKELLGSEAVLWCKSKGQSLRKSFYSVHIDDRIGLKTGNEFALRLLPKRENGFHYFDLGLKIETSSYEEIRDVDGFKASQLLSEVGGIVGVTLGISLLCVFLKLSKRINIKNN